MVGAELEARQIAELTQRVRQGDRDRFLTGLFASPEKRRTLFTIYALEFELARIPDLVSEPMLGEIRLQWWRELIDAIASGHGQNMHPLSAPLIQAITGQHIPRAGLDSLIDGFSADFAAAAEGQADAPPFPGLSAAFDLAATALAGDRASGELPVPPAVSARSAIGALSEGYQLILQILSLGDYASGSQILRIAPSWLAAYGLRRTGLRTAENHDAVMRMTEEMAVTARERLHCAAGEPLFLEQQMRPLGWLISLCAGYLRLLSRAKFDPFDKSMQVPVYRRQIWLMRQLLRPRKLAHGL